MPEKHAPKRYVGANQALFINSKIHIETMRRTRLTNSFRLQNQCQKNSP